MSIGTAIAVMQTLRKARYARTAFLAYEANVGISSIKELLRAMEKGGLICSKKRLMGTFHKGDVTGRMVMRMTRLYYLHPDFRVENTLTDIPTVFPWVSLPT